MSTLVELVAKKQQELDETIILVKVNGKLKEIYDKEITDEKIEYITTKSSIGIDTYKRSVLMLMLAAFNNIDKNKEYGSVRVEYSIAKGFFCDTTNKKPITAKFLTSLKNEMNRLVKADMTINKETYSTSNALKLFKEKGMQDKVRLFNYRRSSVINVYELDGFVDYYYGFMARSTGILKYFDLYQFAHGFVLQLPTKENPELVPEFIPQIKLANVLDQSTKWAHMLDLDTVGALNDHIRDGNIGSLILVQEALQEKKIVEIVNLIKERPQTKFIMIAGPSSSGKTTFSHRLSVQLMASGFKPHPIAVDDYFVEREQTPIDENGDPDFECLGAIDTKLFNEHMTKLLNGEEIERPRFNFKTGRKEYNGEKLKLGKDDILVIEGIHCLNDKLSYTLPVESKFKIYISALTQLNVDEHNRVSTTDGRLVRRLVRDYRTRGANAKKTLSMWESVRRGEERNIFPYQEEADVMFNSAMPYELCVLKPIAEPLLFSIREDEPEYQEAKRMLKFLDYFLPCNADNVPINSILREFVGGGCFRV